MGLLPNGRRQIAVTLLEMDLSARDDKMLKKLVKKSKMNKNPSNLILIAQLFLLCALIAQIAALACCQYLPFSLPNWVIKVNTSYLLQLSLNHLLCTGSNFIYNMLMEKLGKIYELSIWKRTSGCYAMPPEDVLTPFPVSNPMDPSRSCQMICMAKGIHYFYIQQNKTCQCIGYVPLGGDTLL